MMKNVIKSLVVIISLIIVFIFIIEIPKDVVIIEKISMPDNFKKYNIGFTEEVLANHLFDSIYKFQEAEGNEVLSDFVFQSINEMPDIKIPTIKFSLNSLFQYLKRSNFFRIIFNYKYIVIDGDIIVNNTTLKIGFLQLELIKAIISSLKVLNGKAVMRLLKVVSF